MTNSVVAAQLTAAPGKESELQTALLAAVEPSHAEDGCLAYAVHQDDADAARFLLVEVWQSPEASERHRDTPHVQELIGQLGSLLGAPPVMQTYSPIPAGEAAKGTLGVSS